MSAYERDAHDSGVIDFGTIQNRLKTQINNYDHPLTDALKTTLDQGQCESATDEVLFSEADQSLGAFAALSAGGVSRVVAHEVQSRFPEDFLATVLPTPKHYIATHGLDGQKRPQLKEA